MVAKWGEKLSTGILGLDTVLFGGYMAGAMTLLVGGPGTGKTAFALFFAAVRARAGEHTIYATFEEAPERLVAHMDAFGLDGSAAVKAGLLKILDFRPSFDDTVTGDFELDPVQLRIETALKGHEGAALVIDSLQNLLMALGAGARHEQAVHRLFDWCRSREVTTLVTMSDEEGGSFANRVAEYAADCDIHLSQEVTGGLMTRYLRVIKLRGSAHGTNAYPFAFTRRGVSVLPVTATRLDTSVSETRISTGVTGIDAMLGGDGYYEGSSMLISGRAGSGKTNIALSMAASAARQGRNVLYVSFEESPKELRRNIRSLGSAVDDAVESKRLRLHATRAIEFGLEEHLLSVLEMIHDDGIEIVVFDPVSSLAELGSISDIKNTLIRFSNQLKSRGVTFIMTELLPDGSHDFSALTISSIADTWIRLRQVEDGDRLKRSIVVVKSRGSASSDRVRRLLLTDQGILVEDTSDPA